MRDFSFFEECVALTKNTKSAEGASVYFFKDNAETLRQKECVRTVF